MPVRYDPHDPGAADVGAVGARSYSLAIAMLACVAVSIFGGYHPWKTIRILRAVWS